MGLNPYDTPRGRLHRLAQVSRRQFVFLMGIVAAGVGSLFAGFQVLGFMFPNATLEEPLEFSLDVDPSTITTDVPMTVTEKRVTIIRDDAGFYCVYLVCTHLGCTPNYTTDVVVNTGVSESVAKTYGDRTAAEQIPNGWACPCHGSRYFIDSTNFYGPAPRPMDWCDIQFGVAGGFVIDRGTLVVVRNPGQTTKPQWRLNPQTGKSNGLTIP